MIPHVSVIILNWNNWPCTIACLESLFRTEYTNYSVILVDNGSTDNSLEKIKEYCAGKISGLCDSSTALPTIRLIKANDEKYSDLFSSPEEREIFDTESGKTVFLIENEKNNGFAEGNNIGIQFALNRFPLKFVLLLNNDTVVDRFFLNHLVSAAEKYPSAGFFGPKIYYFNYHGRKDVVSQAGGRVNMWTGRSHHIGYMNIDTGQYNQERNVDYLTGACLLVKREVIDRIGLLPRAYFLYWEELAWCFKGQKAGFSCVYIPDSIIWHHICASASSPTFTYYFTRNRFWFIRQNGGGIQKISFFLFFFCIEIWYDLAKLVKHSLKNKNLIVPFFNAVIAGLSHIPEDES
jgi:hypothetical protein